MRKYTTYLVIFMMPVLFFKCKNTQLRGVPEENNVSFQGKIAKIDRSYYRSNEPIDVQIDLNSNDEEAKFRILSWKTANGKQGRLENSSISSGRNMLHYTPLEPGMHEVILKLGVEGEDDSAQEFRFNVNVPLLEWNLTGAIADAENLTLTIADAPEDIRREQWHIQDIRWSRGLHNDIKWPTNLQHGDNRLPIALQDINLEELPEVHINIQGPDRTLKSIAINLRELCIAKLQETYSERKAQEIREHNERIKECASEYQGNYTGLRREEARGALNTMHATITNFKRETRAQLECLRKSVGILWENSQENLGILVRRHTVSYTHLTLPTKA